LSETNLKTNDANTSTAEGAPVLEREPPSPLAEDLVEPRAGFWRRHRLLIATVVLPMATAAVFLLLVFAPRYSSTAAFMVRAVDRSASPNESIVMQAADSSTETTVTTIEPFEVTAFLASRDVVDLLAKNDDLRGILSRPQGDFVFRYPTFWLRDNKEFLYRRFLWAAKTDLDPLTGIVTIEANAFTPHDAQFLVQAMLRYAEALVNRMNDRFYQSEVATAEHSVAEAQKDVDKAEGELKDFRSRSGSLDPNLVAQEELNVVQGLATQLAQVETAIKQQVHLASTSPALVGLRAQAKAYRDNIEKERLEIAGGAGSEAVKLETYDQLALRRDLAVQALADAVTLREQARQEAARQHLYVQIIAQPNLALDWARYPRTTFDLLALLAICACAFSLLRGFLAITAVHRP
jgi:capsular polysaccharide transport system permease protein